MTTLEANQHARPSEYMADLIGKAHFKDQPENNEFECIDRPSIRPRKERHPSRQWRMVRVQTNAPCRTCRPDTAAIWHGLTSARAAHQHQASHSPQSSSWVRSLQAELLREPYRASPTKGRTWLQAMSCDDGLLFRLQLGSAFHRHVSLIQCGI